MVKKVTIVGGSGTVGRILIRGLSDEGYDLTVMDVKKPEEELPARFIQADARNDEETVKAIPEDTDVLINLLAVKPTGNLLDKHEFENMTDIFFKATYTMLMAAVQRGVSKVIFASSNHVTDVYEQNGVSLLKRPIQTEDYPLSKSLYGLLKLASENLGYLFSHHSGVPVSVINLRIGTAVENEKEALLTKPRTKKTLLSKKDLVGIFKSAIEADKTYGTHYAVSDNPDRPWSITSAIRELGYEPKVNSADLMKKD